MNYLDVMFSHKQAGLDDNGDYYERDMFRFTDSTNTVSFNDCAVYLPIFSNPGAAWEYADNNRELFESFGFTF